MWLGSYWQLLMRDIIYYTYNTCIYDYIYICIYIYIHVYSHSFLSTLNAWLLCLSFVASEGCMQRFMASANLLHGFYEHLFFESIMLALVERVDSTRSEEPASNLMLRYASIISSCIHISLRLRLRNQQKAEGPNCRLAEKEMIEWHARGSVTQRGSLCIALYIYILYIYI